MQKASRGGGEKAKSLHQARNKSPLEIEPKGKRRGAPPGPASGEEARSTYRTAAPRRLGSDPRPACRSPPRALEGGGGRRHHNRKFMAWRGGGWGTGGRVVATSWCARSPAPDASSRIRAPGPRAGEEPRPKPRAPPSAARGLCSISGGISAPLRTPCEHRSFTRSEGPEPAWGLRRAPCPRSAPQLWGALISAELPAPTAWIRRRDPTGRHRLPSPHPRASANREQVTTRAASGVAALRRFAGRERPLFSARGAAPPGHARRLLAPTPSRCALKGATRPAGLYPCRGKVMRGEGGGNGPAPRGTLSLHPWDKIPRWPPPVQASGLEEALAQQPPATRFLRPPGPSKIHCRDTAGAWDPAFNKWRPGWEQKPSVMASQSSSGSGMRLTSAEFSVIHRRWRHTGSPAWVSAPTGRPRRSTLCWEKSLETLCWKPEALAVTAE
ncbi:uncharacterized protein LOC109449348 [Rhinolophus sinicus]|uniref:uncharacterized protein LOC109449348 n=1 Tax=Rhinolophus sinicus TaxID=89399 RepID=UPI003D7B485E